MESPPSGVTDRNAFSRPLALFAEYPSSRMWVHLSSSRIDQNPVLIVVPGVGASSVDPLPYILGDDSSESVGDAAGAGSASASASEETTFIKASLSAKAQHLESETESDERPYLVLPQGPKTVPTSPHAIGIGASGFIAEPLHLGKFNF